MSGGHEIMLGYAYLSATLGPDATLQSLAPGGVNRAMAQPSTAIPYIIMAHQAGADTTTMNGFRVFSGLLYQVKAVGPATITATLAAAAARLDVLLGGPPNTPPQNVPIIIGNVTVGMLYTVYREQPLEADEMVTGEQWTNIGGLYRLWIGQVY